MASLTPEDYTIAWICALPLEAAAARAMLDKIHTPLELSKDPNAYDFGELHGHYIVIAYLPNGVYGTVSAAAVVSRMRLTFPRLQFGLMVGVGGGVPSKNNDIRLGDVVVSKPYGKHGGVIQYDYGKAVQGGRFEQAGSLNKPPQALLTHISRSQANWMVNGEGTISKLVYEVLERTPSMREIFSPPEPDTDLLFHSSYRHADTQSDCEKCDRGKLVNRQPRHTRAPYIHYGLIASGDQVMKDSETRDRLAQQLDILCFEMEAAGLMDALPSLVIRGICDYCDSHKQKQWQGYAALTAAAYARSLLSIVPVEPSPKAAPQSNHVYSSEDQRCLQDLLLSHPDDDLRRIEATKGGLLDDSFRWILDNAQYQGWFNNPGSQLLWIKGDAGKGKTMLMIGIVRELQGEIQQSSDMLAFFLCQGMDQRINNATAVLKGLIYMLVTQRPHLLSHLRRRYDPEGKSPFERNENAFHAFAAVFENMINDIKEAKIYLLVDALDECKVGLSDLLNLIARTMSAQSTHLKWIVSSRNIYIVDQVLNLDDKDNKLSLELNANQISSAIETYIGHKISYLDVLQHNEELRERVRDHLFQKSDGTFLWVALVAEELRKCQLEEEVLDTVKAVPTDLPRLYDQMVEQIDQLKGRLREVCLKVLSMVVLSFRPLHLSEMTHIVKIPKIPDIERAVAMCGSFLTIRDKYVYLIHQSAKDHLDEIHVTTAILQERSVTHYEMYRQSLQTLSEKLRRNIYDLSDPSISATEVAAFPPNPDPLFELRYCCIYWLDHFLEADSGPAEKSESIDDQEISKFFKEHLLHWLESLSLIGEVRHGILTLRKVVQQRQEQDTLRPRQRATNLNRSNQRATNLKRRIQRIFRGKKQLKELVPVQPTGHSEHKSILKEFERFATSYGFIIQESPLQTYGAALAFCPPTSEIKKLYWQERLVSLDRVSIMQDSWDPCMQVLEGHEGWVSAVAFSPDGLIIASGSRDGTIRLWDAATGAERRSLQGHKDWVNAVIFTPNGQTIASGTGDGTIQLWDIATGTQSWSRSGYKGSIITLAFLPDNQTIASGSHDGTIQLWDIATGALHQSLQGYKGSGTVVTFASDDQTVASGLADGTIWLWNKVTGARTRQLRGHKASITAITFLPDSRIVVSGSDDRTIRIWNAVTGRECQCLQGHKDWITGVSISPDSQTVASSSGDRTIRLWDIATGAEHCILQSSNSPVTAVAFSPDGWVLVSGSSDGAIRLWDITARTKHQSLPAHRDSVTAVAFSHDGRIIASGSRDQSIRFWDAATGAEHMSTLGHRTLQRNEGSVTALAFSIGTQLVISGSGDGIIQIWNIPLGVKRQRLRNYKGLITAVAISSNSQTVASGYHNGTIRLWDLATGTQYQQLQGHMDFVTSMVFSPDDQIIASSSNDGTIHLWDADAGIKRRSLQSHVAVNKLSFSADGCYLHTDRHALALDHQSSELVEQQDTRIFVQEAWIARNEQRLIRLLPEYRATCVATSGNLVVLGHLSGLLTFIWLT